jgi:hypothetical protein
MCRYSYIYKVSTSVTVHGIMVTQCVDTLTFTRYLQALGTWYYGDLTCRYSNIYKVSISVTVHGIMVTQCVDTLTFTRYL